MAGAWYMKFAMLQEQAYNAVNQFPEVSPPNLADVSPTEKDAVKLSQLAATDDLKIPILVLPIGIEFTEGEEKFCQILSTVGKVAK